MEQANGSGSSRSPQERLLSRYISIKQVIMVELAIMIQVFAMPSHEIDGRVVELRRATSQVGIAFYPVTSYKTSL